ncbi:MAG: hypothetical protein MK135_06490 [Polyangiaceae bacterium]|nr:hypothetical protein [Polyangiaceae bacterium]
MHFITESFSHLFRKAEAVQDQDSLPTLFVEEQMEEVVVPNSTQRIPSVAEQGGVNQAIPSPRIASRLTESEAQQERVRVRKFTLAKSRVLALARRGFIPQGREVPAANGLPAGIALQGVEGVLPDLKNGDRLVAIQGIATTSQAQAVELILAARSSKAPTLRIDVLQPRAGGLQRLEILVEQPY